MSTPEEAGGAVEGAAVVGEPVATATLPAVQDATTQVVRLAAADGGCVGGQTLPLREGQRRCNHHNGEDVTSRFSGECAPGF